MKSREVGFKRLRLPLHRAVTSGFTQSLLAAFFSLRVRRATALHMHTRQRQAQRAHTSGREATTHIRQMSGQCHDVGRRVGGVNIGGYRSPSGRPR